MEFLFVAILLVALIIGNIALARNKLRRVIVILDICVVCLVLFTYFLNVVVKISYQKYDKQYNCLSGTILTSFHYEGENEEYYFIRDSYLFGSDLCAVPKSECKLGTCAGIVGNVYLYTDSSKPNFDYDHPVEIEGKTCVLAPNVVMIMPDLREVFFVSVLLGGAVLFIGNIVTCIILLVQKCKSRKP